MKNLKFIKKRLKAVKNTQHITKAMKMVSSVKLRKAEERTKISKDYYNSLQDLVINILAKTPSYVHPFLQTPKTSSSVLIVITSDKGLCGSFNQNILKEAEKFLKNNRGKRDVKLVVIGKKGEEYFNIRKIKIDYLIKDIEREISKHYQYSYDFSKGILENKILTFDNGLKFSIIDAFLDGKIGEVKVCYSQYISVIKHPVVIETLLPIKIERTKQYKEGNKIEKFDFIYEPSKEFILSKLLINFVFVKFYQFLIESQTSEHAARMTAMDNAYKNTIDLIELLTLQFNRARQAAITKEIIEIVSGAEALKKK